MLLALLRPHALVEQFHSTRNLFVASQEPLCWAQFHNRAQCCSLTEMNRPVSGPFGPSGTEAVVKGGNLGEMRHFRKRSHVRAKCWKFDIPDELEQTALMVDQEAATAEGPSAHHGQFAVDLAEPIGLRGPAFKACARDRMGAIR